MDSLPQFKDGLADIRKDRAGLRNLVAYIHHERGIDFSGYMESTLARRIAVRVNARGAKSFAGYEKVLEKDPAEYSRLLDHLTINVSRFFRNRGALETLVRVLLSLRKTDPHRPISIWSAGCATGQEPFSIAMLLDRQLGDSAREGVSILATDIDGEALKSARKGVFGKEQVQDVPSQMLEQYFDGGKSGYQVKERLRQWVDFQHHNLLYDKPPGAVDVVACRNVLIYFRIPVQVQVVWNFHGALKAGGVLLLGRYEMLGRETRHGFRAVDFDARLYEKQAVNGGRKWATNGQTIPITLY